MRSDRILPSYQFDNNYVVRIPDRKDWEENRVTLNDDVICYTDGSKINTTGRTGAGVFNWTDCEEYYFPTGRVCSVFQTELYAILQCARLESLHVRDSASIAICSDSQAALKSLSAAKVTSALVADTVQARTSVSYLQQSLTCLGAWSPWNTRKRDGRCIGKKGLCYAIYWTRTIRWYHCNHGTERGASLGCERTKLSTAEYCQLPTSEAAC